MPGNKLLLPGNKLLLQGDRRSVLGKVHLDDAISSKHDGLNPLALAVKCALETVSYAAPAGGNKGGAAATGGKQWKQTSPCVPLVEALLGLGASPVALLAPSEGVPESINGVKQDRYRRSPLGLAIVGKVWGCIDIVQTVQ